MTSYEAALERIARLEPAPSNNQRSVEWIDDSGSIGAARTNGGRIELFFVGPKLEVCYRSVADQLVHQEYFRTGGAPFTASRLELPLAGHYDQVAAFICTELIRNGASEDVVSAFTASEPVIDLALETLRNSDSWVRGLIGELSLLKALVENVSQSAIPDVLDGWGGYQPSLRDFSLNEVGVEVKTTGRNAATHTINGLHQLEKQEAENDLFLISFTGLSWFVDAGTSGTPSQSIFTARLLINAVGRRVIEAGHPDSLIERLRFQVSEYLPRNTLHENPLDRPFRWASVRCYDLSDPAIQFLGTDDVARRPNTVLSSVRFDIELPDHVTGDVNPVTGLNRSAMTLLRKAGIESA